MAPLDRDWKACLSDSFRTLEELLEYCETDVPDAAYRSSQAFAPRVTRYFASLIEKGNLRDPLLLQVLPDALELQKSDGYGVDAVGDHDAMRAPGLIHKYHGRALLTLTGACPIHCRYCFRRHFPYAENNADYSAGGQVMSYLSRHEEINEVILSGGDPLMQSDEKLAKLIHNLGKIGHIGLLRIHSRALSVLPERVNDSFLGVLRHFNGQVVLVTHINHPNEISAHNRVAFGRLSAEGHRLFNQSVLLKGVNDSVQTLAELSRKLFASYITPYYLHRLDKVDGAAHFDLSQAESCDIYQRLRRCLPGYLLPEFVEEIAGQSSKMPVRC